MSSAGRSSVDPATARLREARSVLERAVRAGEHVRTEDVLADYPDLGDSSDAFLELAYSEFVLREQLGQEPKPADWLARFPRWEADLRQLFDVHFDIKHEDGELDPIFHPDFEILEEVGRGGMGVVYRARQKSLNRVVALKVVLSGQHAGAKELARFKREGEAAASLQHPNIVQVFEVGEADGRPFCAMEFVSGGTLSKKLDGVPWAAQPAAAFLATTARAVQHAHERGVVHRDLKPANVLLSGDRRQETGNSEEGDGRQEAADSNNDPNHHERRGGSSLSPVSCLLSPKVTDFGLAKCLTDSDPGPTRTGDLLGTPAYMAPEQARGESRGVGPATDVWALGVIFYEMLTGRPPFQGESAVETVRQVQHAEPVPPRRLRPRLSRDLETVCLKCLRKSPAQRYATAAALADDLERWARGEPILARPVGAVGRARRWCGRNPRVAALGGAVVALVAVAGWLGTLAVVNLAAAKARAGKIADQEREAREKEEEARKKEEAARLTERRRVVRLLVADGVRRLDEGDSAGAALWFAAALENEPDEAAADGHRVRLGTTLRDCPPLAGAFQLAVEGRRTPRLSADGSAVYVVAPNGVAVHDARTGALLSPAAGTLRSAGDVDDALTSNGRAVIGIRAKKVVARDTATWARLPIPLPPEYGTPPPQFHPNGSRYTGSRDGRQVQMFAADGTAVGPPLGQLWMFGENARFSPDGRRVAVGEQSGQVRVSDAGTGALLSTLKHGVWVTRVEFSPDGKRLVSAGIDGTSQVWNLETGEPVGYRLQHGGLTSAVLFSPKGDRVVTAGTGRAVRVWNAATGQMVGRPMSHPRTVIGVAFSPDGRSLVTRGPESGVRVWEVETGRPQSPVLGHAGEVAAAQFTPDGRHVVVAGQDGRVRVWDFSPAGRQPVLAEAAPVGYGTWSADGRTAVMTTGRHAVLWNPATGVVARRLDAGGPPTGVVTDTSGRYVATVTLAAVRLWDAAAGRQIGGDLRHAGEIGAALFTPDGQLATCGRDGWVKFWDAATGDPTGRVLHHNGATTSGTLARHGQRLLTGGGGVRLWELPGGTLLREDPRTHAIGVMSADGSVVAVSAMGDRTIRLYHAGDGRPAGEIDAGTQVMTPTLSPDGKWLATNDMWERGVQLWNVETGAKHGPPFAQADSTHPLEFSPDGRFLVTRNGEGAARVWEVATGAAAGPNLEHGRDVRFAQFSPDGGRLLTGSNDFTARVWDLSPDARPVPELLAHARVLAARRFDDRGVLIPLTAEDEADLLAAWRAAKP